MLFILHIHGKYCFPMVLNTVESQPSLSLNFFLESCIRSLISFLNEAFVVFQLKHFTFQFPYQRLVVLLEKYRFLQVSSAARKIWFACFPLNQGDISSSSASGSNGLTRNRPLQGSEQDLCLWNRYTGGINNDRNCLQTSSTRNSRHKVNPVITGISGCPK
jgi:hypothetical protein